jgi:hypothetical protein
MTRQGFWRDARQVSEVNRGLFGAKAFGVVNNVHYIFPQGNGPRGAHSTFAQVSPLLKSRDVVFIGGVLREQAVAPLGVFDVLIVGAANRPRQATSGGTPTGGGATWLAPTSPAATTPLIKIREQGWTFANIMFGPHSDAAAIHAKRREDATDPDPSHFSVLGCYFSGGFIGIQDDGGCHHYLVDDCEFRAQTGAGGGGIVCTSTTVAVPLQNTIRKSRFFDNVQNFASSQQNSVIEECHFDRATTTAISTTFNSVQGGGNHVTRNAFNIVQGQFAPGGSTGAVVGAADDVWYNFLVDAVESGQPA